MSISEMREKLSPSKEILLSSWARLETAIDKEIKEIREKREDVFPEISYQDLESNAGRFPDKKSAEIRNGIHQILKSN
jgi:hypothetical protein